MFNLLIVGGTGFIGRSIHNYLLNNSIGKKFKKIYILSRKSKLSFLKKNNYFQTIKINKLAKVNENIIVVAGMPFGIEGTTNSIRVVTI